MTAFLFGITLLVGFIGGFVACLAITQWAIRDNENEAFKEAGFKFVNGKWSL